MNTRFLLLLCLAVILVLSPCSQAESSPDAAQALQPSAAEVIADPMEAPVDEIGLELGAPEVSAPEAEEAAELPAAGQEAEAENPAAESTPAAGETPAGTDDLGGEGVTTPTDGGEAPETQDTAEGASPEGGEPWVFGEPLEPIRIKLRKDASKTVYQGVPCVIVAKGGIQRCVSWKKSVATASKDGTVTLKKPGTARFTVTTGAGKKLKLTLNVKPSPAPGNPAVAAKAKRITLKWTAAKYATGYLVEFSGDGEQWESLCEVPSNRLSLNVADVVTGTTHFRITAILGDVYGGISDVVSVLTPVTDVRILCEETFNFGPTDRMNVTWSASPGATSYAVYRAAMPSGQFRQIGTTKATWYADTRDPEKLYAYRIQPLRKGAEDTPLSDPVTQWSGLESNVLPPKDLESSSGIILVVNKKAQVVTAYIQDCDGRYTLPLRHMICSTGYSYDRTKNGIYTLQSKRGEWYTYSGPSGTTIRWPSVYRSGYYFHSPLYNRDHTIRGATVRKLGSRASAGCVRLKTNDAEWVYRHCPVGTAVYICDGGARDSLKRAIMPADVSVRGF